jgi:hypothetical protein
MWDRPVDHITSFENACSAREFNLENMLNSFELESRSKLMVNISDKDREKILEKVFTYNLSPKIKEFSLEYEDLFGKRSNFLWKWLGVVYRDSGVSLSTIDKDLVDSVTDTKILLTMLFSILDDVSEFYKDKKLLEELLLIICENSIKKTHNKKLLFFKKLWETFKKDIDGYPRYNEFKEMFDYDFNQMIDSVRFCYLMNQKPEYINLLEMEIHSSYNMIVFLLNGIDLMASTSFDKKDLPHLRTIFWNAQQMARIGNWLSTWKREVKEQDVSSGVIAYALSNNILSIDDLKNLGENDIIKRIENSNMYEYFTVSWKQKFENIKKFKDKIKSVDINKYIQGLETLIKLHLASEGFK